MLANHENLLGKYEDRNLPKSSKKSWWFHNFLPQNVMIFFGFFLKSSLDHVAWDYSYSKMAKFHHTKKMAVPNTSFNFYDEYN